MNVYLRVFSMSAVMLLSFSWQPLHAQEPEATDGPEAPPKGEGPQRWAIVIGVGKHLTLPALSHAADDAVLVHRALAAGGFDPRRMRLVADKAPLKPLSGEIKRVLAKALKFVGREDTLVVFFSGHVVRDQGGNGYLAAADADLERLGETAIPLAELRQLLGRCRAKHKVLILDVWHAPVGEEEALPPFVQIDPMRLARQVGGEGTATLVGCGPEQKSHVSPELKHGVFAFFLAEGLAGHADQDENEWVELDELAVFVRDNTRLYVTKELGGKQEPIKDVHTRGRVRLTKFDAKAIAVVERDDPDAPGPAGDVDPEQAARRLAQGQKRLAQFREFLDKMGPVLAQPVTEEDVEMLLEVVPDLKASGGLANLRGLRQQGPITLDKIIAAIEAEPALKAVLDKHGVTARQVAEKGLTVAIAAGIKTRIGSVEKLKEMVPAWKKMAGQRFSDEMMETIVEPGLDMLVEMAESIPEESYEAVGPRAQDLVNMLENLREGRRRGPPRDDEDDEPEPAAEDEPEE